MTVSRGGGGDCKGISKQTVVPSTNASKENMCEATFALMPMCTLMIYRSDPTRAYVPNVATLRPIWRRPHNSGQHMCTKCA